MRITVAVVLVTAAVVVVSVVAFRSASSSCSYSVAAPDLPAALRAQGGFDQTFDTTDTATLKQTAQLAATSSSADLIGVRPGTPVTVASADASRPDAVIVPLAVASPAGTTHVAGLTLFLRDCGGRLHYSRTDSLASAPLAAFPLIAENDAAARLGAPVRLVYTTDPTRPEWRTAGGATLAAT